MIALYTKVLTILLHVGKKAPRTTNPLSAPPDDPKILMEAWLTIENMLASIPLM